MPKVTANTITMNYDQQGTGEPLILIPYLAADHACYAFQVPEYAKHFTCISVDLRGTGESDKPPVASLSVHSGWTRTDRFLQSVVESWQIVAKAVDVPEMTIRAIFPWCFTPELYAERPDYIESLAAFVRSRPPQSVPDFLRQADAVLAHDVEPHLGRILAPTHITVGTRDQLTSTRFADRLKRGIRNSELLVFDGCAHAAMYERVEEFNQRTLAFLRRYEGAAVG